jgi:isochorismate synthase
LFFAETKHLKILHPYSSKIIIFVCLQHAGIDRGFFPEKRCKPNHYKPFMYQQLQSTLQQLLGDEQAFFAFRQPGEEVLRLSTIKAAEPFDYSQLEKPQTGHGFVVFPFSPQNEQGWWLTGDHHREFPTHQQETLPHQTPLKMDEMPGEFSNYAAHFKEMMAALDKGKIQKVILSRTIQVNHALTNDIPVIFARLLQQYPKAFTYLVASRQTGIWMGASPELLFSRQDGMCTTVSLAGTRSHDAADASWTQKEMKEQGLVSNYIDNLLKTFNVVSYQKEGPFIIKAGNLTHLKTSYAFADAPTFKLAQFVEALHPTPALCGEPKEKAMVLIQQVEKHDRSYYGGFLGPVNQDSINLYVNIRCIKVAPTHSTIFVGGGLTQQSDLHSEWNETILKSNTILSAITSRT